MTTGAVADRALTGSSLHHPAGGPAGVTGRRVLGGTNLTFNLYGSYRRVLCRTPDCS